VASKSSQINPEEIDMTEIKNGAPTLKDAHKIDKKITEDKRLDEWSNVTPSGKDMGLIKLTLDRGVKTTVVGTLYGLDFEIEDEGYRLRLFFDYYNRRLKIIDYETDNDDAYPAITKRLAWLAEHNSFDKIFLKAQKHDFQKFLAQGYVMEGVLRYYFRGQDAYVLSRFSSSGRAQSDHLVEEANLVENLLHNTKNRTIKELDPKITIQTATYDDIPQLVLIYRSVFETYPSPLTNPDYIQATMNKHVLYKIAVEDKTALAAASADMNEKHSNAELTDCATVPAAQGKGIMQHILKSLETDLKDRGIMTAYTLSRALSIGMNRAFYRMNYEYSGRLINNCDIFGKFEDMNIWVKKLS